MSTVLPLPKLVVTLTWPWCNSINMTSMVPGEEVSTSIPSGKRVLKRKKMSSNLVWVLLFRVTLTYDTPLKDTRVASEGKNHKSDQISTLIIKWDRNIFYRITHVLLKIELIWHYSHILYPQPDFIVSNKLSPYSTQPHPSPSPPKQCMSTEVSNTF